MITERQIEDMLGRPIQKLSRRPCPYASTFPLEELDLDLADGTHLALLWKDLSPGSLLPEAEGIKPSFLYDPEREIGVYREILAAAGLGTAACHGTICEPATPCYALLLERVTGPVLWQMGEFDTWLAAARWSRRLHDEFQADQLPATSVPLFRYDADYYRRWMQRTIELADGTARAAKVQQLAARHERLVEQLVALPSTFIHGEFYASNILVDDSRICPIDWEMAGIGPAMMDMAALTSGAWTEPQRQAMLAAYLGGAADRQAMNALDGCRLHLAIRWLGWSASWQPPSEHVQDWLQVAIDTSERLGL